MDVSVPAKDSSISSVDVPAEGERDDKDSGFQNQYFHEGCAER